MKKTKTLFLDRDGVINNIDQGFVNSIDDFMFCAGALEAILYLINTLIERWS